MQTEGVLLDVEQVSMDFKERYGLEVTRPAMELIRILISSYTEDVPESWQIISSYLQLDYDEERNLLLSKRYYVEENVIMFIKSIAIYNECTERVSVPDIIHWLSLEEVQSMLKPFPTRVPRERG